MLYFVKAVLLQVLAINNYILSTEIFPSDSKQNHYLPPFKETLFELISFKNFMLNAFI